MTSTKDEKSTYNGPNVSISKKQFDHLFDLLEHFNIATYGPNFSINNVKTLGTVNFAGTIACTFSIDFDKLSCCCFKGKTDLWILDSGASHNMTFNRSQLINVFTIPYPLLVRLYNGYKVKVTKVRNVVLPPKTTL